MNFTAYNVERGRCCCSNTLPVKAQLRKAVLRLLPSGERFTFCDLILLFKRNKLPILHDDDHRFPDRVSLLIKGELPGYAFEIL